MQRSGQEAGEVIQQISDTVFPMYKAFIEPCLKNAHIRVVNTFNPFAGFKEPIQILKTEESVTVEMAMACLREILPDQEIKQVCHACAPSPATAGLRTETLAIKCPRSRHHCFAEAHTTAQASGAVERCTDMKIVNNVSSC